MSDELIGYKNGADLILKSSMHTERVSMVHLMVALDTMYGDLHTRGTVDLAEPENGDLHTRGTVDLAERPSCAHVPIRLSAAGVTKPLSGLP